MLLPKTELFTALCVCACVCVCVCVCVHTHAHEHTHIFMDLQVFQIQYLCFVSYIVMFAFTFPNLIPFDLIHSPLFHFLVYYFYYILGKTITCSMFRIFAYISFSL